MKYSLASMALIGTLFVPLAVYAQSAIGIQALWRIDGTPLGTERALEPYLALTNERLFISGSIEIDGNRRQVIQVFNAETGAYVQTIEDPSGAVFAGHSDTIAANTRFMVTSTYHGSSAGAGALQIFDSATGEHLRTINNPRAGDSTFFGQLPIALSGNRVMAGVALSRDNQSTVWVFDAETGETVLTLDEPDNAAGFFSKAERTIFGSAKALSPTHALISAPQKSLDDDKRVGAVFLYDAKTGELLQTFMPSEPQTDMFFGQNIALSDTVAFVSVSRNLGPRNWPAGEIAAYDLATGELMYTLQDPQIPQTVEDVLAGVTGSGFGDTFVVKDGRLIVGQPGLAGPAGKMLGGLKIYDARTGKEILSYANTSGALNENLGTALAISDAGLAVLSRPEIVSFRKHTRGYMFEMQD